MLVEFVVEEKVELVVEFVGVVPVVSALDVAVEFEVVVVVVVVCDLTVNTYSL